MLTKCRPLAGELVGGAGAPSGLALEPRARRALGQPAGGPRPAGIQLPTIATNIGSMIVTIIHSTFFITPRLTDVDRGVKLS